MNVTLANNYQSVEHSEPRNLATVENCGYKSHYVAIFLFDVGIGMPARAAYKTACVQWYETIQLHIANASTQHTHSKLQSNDVSEFFFVRTFEYMHFLIHWRSVLFQA